MLVAVAAWAEDAAETSPAGWKTKLSKDPEAARFTWGAEFGSTIDMSGRQMSSIDFNAMAGVRYKWLSMAGAGAGADIMVSNSCRTYPIFAVLRTDFSSLVKIVFIDLRGGVALNYLEGNARQTGGYVSPSIGFKLATGTTFRSYLSVGYTYISRHDYERHDENIRCKPLSMATVRLGVAF